MMIRDIESTELTLIDRSCKETLQYAVGGLLYSPATNINITNYICMPAQNHVTSVALCLEDAIADVSVPFAEEQLIVTLSQVHENIEKGRLSAGDVPLIFIRPRSCDHMKSVYRRAKHFSDIITGFVLPKFDLKNAQQYAEAIQELNRETDNRIYIMPILESEDLICLSARAKNLLSLKSIVDDIEAYVLNIRVGGNDFCGLYGFRRMADESIYDIAVVRDALSDIMNVFGRDYVVSGPVWEYFEGNMDNRWRVGLEHELKLDRLNGFIGKTAIHPSQLPVIANALAVSISDYQDAQAIMKWDDTVLGVAKSVDGRRMNERKVHRKWAIKTLIMAQIYGLKQNEEKN